MDIILENLAIFWLVMTIVFLVIEALTAALTTIWFAGGSLLTIVLSFFVDSFTIQIIFCVVVSAVLLIFTRPMLSKNIDKQKIKTNVDSLIGKTGFMIAPAPKFETGQAKIISQIWTVKSINNDTLDLNDEVRVVSVEGVKLMVEKVKKEEL